MRERRAQLSDLPDDVLTKIYSLVRFDGTVGLIRYYSRTSHHWPVVSKRFRAISCKPELWNVVRLQNPTPEMYRWLTARGAGLKELFVSLNFEGHDSYTDGHLQPVADDMLAGIVDALLDDTFEQLESLSLSYSGSGEEWSSNSNQAFPMLCELTQLRTLRMKHFCTPEIAEDMKEISQLQRLTALSLDTTLGSECSDEAQLDFSAGLAALTGLQSLTITNSCLRFPECATSLSSLSRLVLSKDCFNEDEDADVKLPASISNLTRLAWLEVGSLNGSLRHIEGISSLHFLRIGIHRRNLLSDNEGFCSPISALHCKWRNQVKTVLQGEEELLSLVPAQMRTLKYAAFENLDRDIKQPEMAWRQPFPGVLFRRLPNLQVLSMKRGGLHELPPGLTALSHLEVLNLCQNHLPEVPQLLRSITTLTHLDMSYNDELQLDKEGVQCLLALPKLQLLSLAKQYAYQFPRGKFFGEIPRGPRIPLALEKWNDGSLHYLTVLAREGFTLALLGDQFDDTNRVEVKAIDTQGMRSYQVYCSGRLLE